MPAIKYNVTWEQGATATLSFTWADEDETPRDLTGWTARMQVRQKFDSPTTLAEFTTEEGGGIEINGEAGEVTVSAPALETSEWDWPGNGKARTALYDLLMTDPSGTTIRLLEGQIKLMVGVTRG